MRLKRKKRKKWKKRKKRDDRTYQKRQVQRLPPVLTLPLVPESGRTAIGCQSAAGACICCVSPSLSRYFRVKVYRAGTSKDR